MIAASFSQDALATPATPKEGTLRLLLLEDSPDDAALTLLTLERAGYRTECTLVDRRETFVAALEENSFDLLLTDLALPSFSGMEALELTRLRRPSLPVVFLTGAMSEEEVAEAMRRGASDVVVKDRLRRLPVAVVRVLKERATEAALDETQARLAEITEQSRMIVQSTRDCIKVLSTDGRLLSMNPEGQQRLGICAFEDVRNKPWVSFWEEKGRAMAQAAIDAAVAGGEGRFEGCFRTPSGEQTWWDISVTPIRDREQEIMQLLAVSREITARRMAEDALREARDQAQRQLVEIEALYRATPMGLALISADEFRFLRVNDALAAMGDRSPADIVGKTIRELPAALIAEVEERCRRVVETGKPVRDANHEVELPGQPGVMRHWITNYYPVFDPSGAVEAISGSAVEITAQRRAEEALRQTEKLAAVGRLASSISHEINNPLEAAINLLYLASNSNDLLETRWYLSKAAPELGRISQIATQTLRFHRQATNARPMVPLEMVEPVIALYQGRLTNSSIRVERRDRTRAAVTCFEGDIRQVLNNLVGNALDAMRRGGRLFVRTREATDWRTGRKGVRITVADTGSGMSGETRGRLYEAFFTTKGISGTGLGMWVSKGIVDKHAGRLSLRTRDTESLSGTVFALFLPFALEEQRAA